MVLTLGIIIISLSIHVIITPNHYVTKNIPILNNAYPIYCNSTNTIENNERDFLLEWVIEPFFVAPRHVLMIYPNGSLYYGSFLSHRNKFQIDNVKEIITIDNKTRIAMLNNTIDQDLNINELKYFFNKEICKESKMVNYSKNITEFNISFELYSFYSGKISPSGVNKIKQVFNKYEFNLMNDFNYIERWVSNEDERGMPYIPPTTFITFSFHNQTKIIQEYGSDGPENLHDLQYEAKKIIREDISLNESYKFFYSKLNTSQLQWTSYITEESSAPFSQLQLIEIVLIFTFLIFEVIVIILIYKESKKSIELH